MKNKNYVSAIALSAALAMSSTAWAFGTTNNQNNNQNQSNNQTQTNAQTTNQTNQQSVIVNAAKQGDQVVEVTDNSNTNVVSYSQGGAGGAGGKGGAGGNADSNSNSRSNSDSNSKSSADSNSDSNANASNGSNSVVTTFNGSQASAETAYAGQATTCVAVLAAQSRAGGFSLGGIDGDCRAAIASERNFKLYEQFQNTHPYKAKFFLDKGFEYAILANPSAAKIYASGARQTIVDVVLSYGAIGLLFL